MREFFLFGKEFKPVSQWQAGAWINVTMPTDDDLQYLDRLGVPSSFVSDISDADERPRTETDEEWLLTVLRVPKETRDDDIPFSTIPIGVITNGDLVVTICCYGNPVFEDFIKYNYMKKIDIGNKLALIMRLILSSAVWFLKYLKQINIDINEAEDRLEESMLNEDLLRLRNIQKSLVYFNTSVRGNEALILRLRTLFQNTSLFDQDLYNDVEIELKQALNTVNIYSDILSGNLDTYASIISNNLNVMMKRMTATTIILMFPTFIASVYGMNVELPFVHHLWAFWIIVALCVVFSALAFFLFRKIKWF